MNTFWSPFLRLLKCRKASRNLDILWEKGSQDHSNFFVVILKLNFFLSVIFSDIIKMRRKWQPTLVFLLGESPWTEEPGRLQLIES